ncbi:SAM domain-containing protein [Ascosphaera apis ARSEF 7405]|uniref:SAM domain-containing protein n=1 Tax=Ascosphaera apis ARSEF 7405 TaxID=392613 RepID=A0A162I3U9_9EURO|nr:SAM domain-containing protein [Ascosphaera apis ARSEF 7405]
MASHIIGDRTSTPDSTSKSTTLRPPSTSTSTSTSTSRGLSTSHQIRASADMSSLTAPLSARTTRPRSEIFYRNTPQHLLVAASSSSTAAATATATTTAADEAAAAAADDDDRATQQWLDDIEQYQTLLEEMAAATLDHGFKGELSSIEQWFRILSEAERTAALYSLLQQTTQVQIRFFIAVLQQMARSNPVSGILLSPAGGFGESDPMSNRLNEAMSNLHIDNIDNNNNNNARNSLVNRPPLSPGAATTTTTTNTSTTTTATANNTTNNKQRNSGLDSSTINAMFPEAAAVIAKKKAEFSQQQTQTQTQQQTQAQGQMTSNSPNRNSSAFEQRNPLVTPVISTLGSKDSPMSQPPASPWRRTPDPLPLSMSLSQGQHHHQQQHQQQPPIARPKSSSSQQQQPMLNQFPQSQSHTHTSPNLRSPHDDENIRNTTITVPDLSTETASLLSPYNIGASWASMTNTPMMSSFSQAQAQSQAQTQGQAQQVPSPGPSQADMVANATAMKLAALSTVNGRFALDDARKYRRARSNDGQGVHTPHNHLQHNGGNNNYHHHHHHQQQHHQINNTITDPTTPLGFMQHTPQPLTPSVYSQLTNQSSSAKEHPNECSDVF